MKSRKDELNLFTKEKTTISETTSGRNRRRRTEEEVDEGSGLMRVDQGDGKRSEML